MTHLFVRLFVLSLLAGSCGCQVALPQPGQTPQQVRACSTDATAENAFNATGNVLAGGAAVEGAVATQLPSKDAQAMGIATAVTAGVSAGLLLVATYFGKAYNADNCSSAIPGAPAANMVKAP